MNTNEKLNEEKRISRIQKIKQFYKQNCLAIWILITVGLVSGFVSYNIFKVPDNVYKQEQKQEVKIDEPVPKMVDREQEMLQRNALEERQNFFSYAQDLYKEIDNQIAAEQQFLSKKNLHNLADLSIESKYWLDKGENLPRKFRTENLQGFLEDDKKNFKELNEELDKLDISDYPEWKVLKKNHESLVKDIEYLNEMSKRILKEE